MVQARAELEVIVAGLAAQARDEAGVELLRTRLTAMRECPDAEFPEADTAFHAALGELAGNTVLRDMLKGMRAMIQRGWVERTGRSAPARWPTTTTYRSSRRVANGDAEAARAAMARHMDGASRRLMKALEQREG